jgi:hypothetical protein
MRAPTIPSIHGTLVLKLAQELFADKTTFSEHFRKWPLGVNEWHSRGKVFEGIENHNTTYKIFIRNKARRPNRNVAGLVDESEKRTEKVKAVILVML